MPNARNRVWDYFTFYTKKCFIQYLMPRFMHLSGNTLSVAKLTFDFRYLIQTAEFEFQKLVFELSEFVSLLLVKLGVWRGVYSCRIVYSFVSLLLIKLGVWRACVQLPKFYFLCEDSIWGVRKACAECFAQVSTVCSPAVRRTELSQLFINLIYDQSRWVR